MGWLSALRAPSIRKLAKDSGPLQIGLFDEVNFCEIAHPDYPGERLVACRNPLLAGERARKREALLASTEAELDGIYVLRTTIGEDDLDTAGVISAYKDLQGVERDFRSMKAIDVDIRPVHHRLEDRDRAHAFPCFLAAYLTFHLRTTLAPLTFTEPPGRSDPVAPSPRSASAKKKDATKKNAEDEEVRGFGEHLGTLTRNRMRVVTGQGATFDLLATPTPTQRRAFELLGVPVPRTLV